jgi:hypothetical protein
MCEMLCFVVLCCCLCLELFIQSGPHVLDVILLLTICGCCCLHRPIEDQLLKLRFNHRGRFVTFLVRLYVDGCVDEVEGTFDTDKLCFEDIKKLVLSFGYLKFSICGTNIQNSHFSVALSL